MTDKTPEGFFDPDLLPWEPENGIEGLYSKTLSEDPATGSYSRMLKFLPGVDTSPMGAVAHEHLEEVWIIEGSLFDLTLDQNFVAGMYSHRHPGMRHGPWRSPGGVITFEARDFDPGRRITKPELEFHDVGLVSWSRLDPDAGVYIKTLTECQTTASYGRLVRFAPGARMPRQLEGSRDRSEVLVLSGVLASSKGEAHPAGHYGNAVMDLLDGTWTSPYGCTLLEIRNVP